MSPRNTAPASTPQLIVQNASMSDAIDSGIENQAASDASQNARNQGQTGGKQPVPQTGSGAADSSIIGATLAINQSEADAALDKVGGRRKKRKRTRKRSRKRRKKRIKKRTRRKRSRKRRKKRSRKKRKKRSRKY